jgi:uncharacterized protein (DUF362 family)
MTQVSISLAQVAQYPDLPPFHPDTHYPEYPWREISTAKNAVYSAVREGLFTLRLDSDHFGSTQWNPLEHLVEPGQTVVIKPNFVLHFNSNSSDPLSVITHGAVMRAVIDYVVIALHGEGTIIVADAPQMNADFARLVEISGIGIVLDYFRTQETNLSFQLRDLRRERTFYRHGIVWKRESLEGDPDGYTLVDFGKYSAMQGIDASRLYGADYHRVETVAAHSAGHHQYLIANTYLKADTVIHIPKLKTHYKAGITVNLKGMVGLSGNKNLIPHYRVGTQAEGGDEFSRSHALMRIDRWIKDRTIGINWKLGRFPYVIWKMFYSFLIKSNSDLPEAKGNWYGNDIVWRSALDLTRIILYADKDGKLQINQQRKFFSVVDGIIAGEAEGPLSPSRRAEGVILCGENPVSVDYAAALWMKFDPMKVHLLRQAWRLDSYPLIQEPLEQISLIFTRQAKERFVNNRPFTPPKGWQGHL